MAKATAGKTLKIAYAGPPFEHFLTPFNKIKARLLSGSGELRNELYDAEAVLTVYSLDVTSVPVHQLDEAVKAIQAIDQSVKSVEVE